MNSSIKIFVIVTLLAGWNCKGKSEEKDHGHDAEAGDVVTEESANYALDAEVMKIHDEVMPKMDNIHRKKEELKNKIAADPKMSEEKKKAIELKIARLDSASDAMFSWMHKYSPLPDSVGEEKARAYLENEIENIKKVRSRILQALEDADKE
jgi:hypothetical protein